MPTDTQNRPFTVKNPTAWERWREANSDPYGRAAVNYAGRWMALMEAAITLDPADIPGVLAKHADRLSHTADTEGISGYMHGAAAGWIARNWTHAEPFLRWYNRDVAGARGDAATAKGVALNPALVTVTHR